MPLQFGFLFLPVDKEASPSRLDFLLVSVFLNQLCLENKEKEVPRTLLLRADDVEVPVHSGTGMGEGQASTLPAQNTEVFKGGTGSASLEWGLTSKQGTAQVAFISQPVA